MMIFFWIIIIMVLYYIFGYHEKANMANTQESSVKNVLKMRYVNGEIDEEAYEKMKKTLRY